MTDLIAWLDVETTGLDATQDQLLEVALVMTDWNLNVLDGGYSTAIKYTAATASALRAKSAPFVQEMHDRTGLWERLESPSARPIETVRKQIFEYLKHFAPNPRQARLGGNSVGLDASFSREYLPDFYEHLHYRVLDMSSLQEAASRWFEVPTFEKVLDHSALSDIMESIEQAKFIRNQLALKMVDPR